MGDQNAQYPAYEGFQGKVGRTFAGSEGWWPPRTEPPEGAPNIVVIMVDDLGYSDLSCYGSEIPTPHLDALADCGLRYTDFHVTPMCSPTRASLLTGLNPHLAGVGTVAHSDAGFPGYAMELRDDVTTLPQLLRDHGYATFMVGKWHLTKDSDQSAAGPHHSWPLQKGFDRYYGVLDAFTNLHHPHRLVEDNHAVDIDTYPDGYYFTDDITDRAISMITGLKASNPNKPFFLYQAHGAVHAPLHAKPDDMAAFAGAFDAGWDVLRDARFARQQEMGLVADGTELPPRNHETGNHVLPWNSLSERDQGLFARYMETYAGMVRSVDHNVGRLVQTLRDLDELDNTVFIFTSDNGSSREGEEVGTTAYYVHLLQGDDLDADFARVDQIGGPRTMPHMPRGWAMLGNTPFRLYKINTHAGGHTVPFIVHWPEGQKRGLLTEAGSLRRQYAHVTDLLPTLLDLAGLDPDVVAGPRNGSTFAPTLADATAPSQHAEQHYEMIGHRGFYRDGWEIVTLHQPLTPFSDNEWELYHLADDPTEIHNLAAEHPERVRELADAWEQAAWDNQVYPLDEGSSLKYLIRPERSAVFGEPVKVLAGAPTLERWRSVQLLWFRGIRFDVHLGEHGYQPGDAGVLVSHGDQGSGYLLYVDDGRLHYAHNDGRGHMRRVATEPLGDGVSVMTLDKHAGGGGVWTVRLLVDGEERTSMEGVPLLYGMAPFEGITIGRDPRSPVDWDLSQQHGSYAYSGDLRYASITPGDPAPDGPESMIDLLREMGLKYE